MAKIPRFERSLINQPATRTPKWWLSDCGIGKGLNGARDKLRD